MRKISILVLSSIVLFSCAKKESKRDTAINLVKLEYGNVRLNFDGAKLDSLYTILPANYIDSVKKGKELDVRLTELEGQIEHLPQSQSDSVGRISASLTKQRYRLLALEKDKPKFIGFQLNQVRIKGDQKKILSFNFDKTITKLLK
ncbi:hypothetical protein ACVWYG_002174 [Pedobacter sp. UYEF25]